MCPPNIFFLPSHVSISTKCLCVTHPATLRQIHPPPLKTPLKRRLSSNPSLQKGWTFRLSPVRMMTGIIKWMTSRAFSDEIRQVWRENSRENVPKLLKTNLLNLIVAWFVRPRKFARGWNSNDCLVITPRLSWWHPGDSAQPNWKSRSQNCTTFSEIWFLHETFRTWDCTGAFFSGGAFSVRERNWYCRGYKRN
jgi:hypothetical protein